MLATNNSGKVNEFNSFFNKQYDFLTLKDLKIKSCDEPFDTFVENALAKARNASLLGGLPSLADDSGLMVNILNGEPGVRSARFAKPNLKLNQDEANNQKLLDLMSNIKDFKKRKAVFVSVIVFVRTPTDPLPIITHGYWQGIIHFEPKGTNGFGYDPIFYCPYFKKTAAEMLKEEKMQISHRAKAIKKMNLLLREQCDKNI